MQAPTLSCWVPSALQDVLQVPRRCQACGENGGAGGLAPAQGHSLRACFFFCTTGIRTASLAGLQRGIHELENQQKWGAHRCWFSAATDPPCASHRGSRGAVRLGTPSPGETGLLLLVSACWQAPSRPLPSRNSQSKMGEEAAMRTTARTSICWDLLCAGPCTKCVTSSNGLRHTNPGSWYFVAILHFGRRT